MKPSITLPITIAVVVVFISISFAQDLLKRQQAPVFLRAQNDGIPTAIAGSAPTPTFIPWPATGDCGWVARPRAFVDTNGNGKWDNRERPLAGVSFHVDDVYNHFEDVANEVISDSSGVGELFIFSAGCPNTEFEVYAIPPAGYTPTTPARLPGDGPLTFGFKLGAELPGMPGTGHP
jgi:hypothetical protein